MIRSIPVVQFRPMDSLKTALFENPLGIYIALGAAEVVLLLIWRARRTKRSAAALAAGPILAGIVLLVAALVVTNREQIQSACDEIAEAVNHRDLASVERHLDEDFAGPYQPTEKLIRLADNAIRQYNLNTISLRILNLEFTDRQAIMKLRTWFRVGTTGDEEIGHAVLDWKIFWIQRPDGWRIIEVDRPIRARSLAK